MQWRSLRATLSSEYFVIAGLFSAALLLFAHHLDFASFPIFDESRYVPAARELLDHGFNQNWSHPPLGKWLIGIGIRMFGDDPAGWRGMSALFGALTVIAMYLCGRALFGDRRSSMEVAILCLANQMLFVQSRIAMLDIFMFGFIAWALVLVLQSRRGLADWGAAVLLGLSMAVKWFGVVPWAFCFVLALVRLRSRSPASAKAFVRCLTVWGLAPALTYFAVNLSIVGMVHPSYAPKLSLSLLSEAKAAEVSAAVQTYEAKDLFSLQAEIFRAQTAFKQEDHPYQSDWFSWPVMTQPIWYGWSMQWPLPKGTKQGILFIGNPWVLWSGILAVFYCAWSALRRKSKEAGLITALYFSFWLSWSVLPRQTGYAYYYFPAGMVLSFALVFWLRNVVPRSPLRAAFVLVSVAVFLFFYPVLSGKVIEQTEFDRRLWLPGWHEKNV